MGVVVFLDSFTFILIRFINRCLGCSFSVFLVHGSPHLWVASATLMYDDVVIIHIAPSRSVLCLIGGIKAQKMIKRILERKFTSN